MFNKNLIQQTDPIVYSTNTIFATLAEWSPSGELGLMYRNDGCISFSLVSKILFDVDLN